MSSEEPAETLTQYFMQYMSPERIARVLQVASERTRYLTLVLEDIYQSHNASATLRTCECLGIQDIHVIENRNPYEVNKHVVQGSAKWVNLIRYNQVDQDNTSQCISQLKAQGYRVVATSLHGNPKNLVDISLEQPLAIIFGNEEFGISDTALAQADDSLILPMYGFTQSYNISVSVGMAFSYFIRELRNSDHQWELSAEEKDSLILDWCRKSVQRNEALEKHYYQKKHLHASQSD